MTDESGESPSGQSAQVGDAGKVATDAEATAAALDAMPDTVDRAITQALLNAEDAIVRRVVLVTGSALLKSRATIAAQQQEIARNAPWFNFGCEVWRWLPDHWESEDGWDLAEIAVKCGLAERVKYDPAKHGELECETGDEITYPLKGDPEHINESRAALVNATLERAATGLDTVRHAHSEGGCIHCRAVSECQAAIRALKTTEGA